MMLLKALRGLFSNDLSIDLGTANTLIYSANAGIVLNEPSVVAVRHEKNGSKSVVLVGREAKNIIEKTPRGMETIRPLREGVIADFSITEKMLQYFINKVHENKIFSPSPRVLICVSGGSTQVERRAIKESALGAGAREVYLLDEPMAAAIGAGLPFDQPYGSMVLNIGGGTTEVAVVSLNGVAYSSSARIGGDKFDEAIISYVRRHFGFMIGSPTAERIKIEIGTALPTAETHEISVNGRNLAEGAPRSFIINSNEVLEALQEPLAAIISNVRQALENTPPELGADVAHHGIVLAGGGAMLRNMDQLISEETGLPVIVAEDPLTCVVRGGGEVLKQYKDKGSLLFASE